MLRCNPQTSRGTVGDAGLIGLNNEEVAGHRICAAWGTTGYTTANRSQVASWRFQLESIETTTTEADE